MSSRKKKQQNRTEQNPVDQDFMPPSNGQAAPPPAPPVTEPPCPKFAPEVVPKPDVPDPALPFQLNNVDAENIRRQIIHRKSAYQIGELSSTIFKYAVYYRKTWYFITHHVFDNRIIGAVTFDSLKDDEKEKFFMYKDRKDAEERMVPTSVVS